MRLLLLLALGAAAARADVVFLNDGREINGAIVRMDAAKLYVREGGREDAYARADVLKVKLVREWRVPGENEPSQIADETVKRALAEPASPADYPDDGQLVVLQSKDCRVGRDRGAVCTVRRVSRVLRERGKDAAANVRTYYMPDAQKVSIDYARAITSGKISYLDDTSVEDGAENAQYPDYDLQRSLKYAIPDVSTGSLVDYRTRVETTIDVSTRPFFERAYFRGFEPALVERFSITAPKELDLRAAEYRMPKDAEFRAEEDGDGVRWTWTVRKTASIKEEDSMPPYARIAPQVSVAPADTWENVAAAVSSRLQDRLDPGAELAAKTDALVAGKADDAAKVEALYDWVAREIKYVPVGMDSYSYVPKTPAEILKAKAGNVLDKPYLLYVMLRRAGLAPQLIYAAAKSDAPLQESLPSLAQLAAAAVRVRAGGVDRVLVPEEDALRWKAVPGWLQGSRALVVDGAGRGRLVDVPLSPAADESESSRERLTLGADGSIAGEIEIRPRGAHEEGWRAYKDSKKEDVDAQFERLAHSIHPNARLTSYSIEGLDDLSHDVVVKLAFAIPDYALSASGGYLAFRIPWAERGAGDVGKPTRELPMFWYSRDKTALDAEVALPAGYEVYYAPEPADLAAPGFAYRASFAQEEGGLRYREERVADATEVSPEDYPKYKKFVEDTARFTQKWIVIRKRGAR
jgi:hypothetical protein